MTDRNLFLRSSAASDVRSDSRQVVGGAGPSVVGDGRTARYVLLYPRPQGGWNRRNGWGGCWLLLRSHFGDSKLGSRGASHLLPNDVLNAGARRNIELAAATAAGPPVGSRDFPIFSIPGALLACCSLAAGHLNFSLSRSPVLDEKSLYLVALHSPVCCTCMEYLMLFLAPDLPTAMVPRIHGSKETTFLVSANRG